MNPTEQQSSESAVYAKFQKGVPFAIIQDQLIEFEDSYQARNLMQGGSIPDFTRMQDTYCFQFGGTVELITQYRKNDWWEDCHMSVYQQWRDDGRGKDIRKIARLIPHQPASESVSSFSEEDRKRIEIETERYARSIGYAEFCRYHYNNGIEYATKYERERQASELEQLRSEREVLLKALEFGELELRTMYERHNGYLGSTALFVMQEALKLKSALQGE